VTVLAPESISTDQRAREDFEFILASARAGRAMGIDNCIHLDQPIGIWNYVRIADDIVQQVPRGDVLDWGCGYGQMTYLLKRRGLNVTSFDVGDPVQLPDIPLCRGLEVVYNGHPTALPFPDRRFDAVLSCGVLEHVDEMSEPGNEIKSLHEIARVLKPGGTFFVYQLPQRFAWQEAVLRRLKIGYTHPRRFHLAELAALLGQTGFAVKRVRRANLLPKTLTGMPEGLRRAYGKSGRALVALDAGLAGLPGIRHVAGVLEVTARRGGS
jgi:SAM-dependent methyltransferase